MKSAPLRAIRHERSEFDPRFFERHPSFWPIARAARTFVSNGEWPDVRDYVSAFEGVEPVVRFEPAPLKRKRAPGPIARDELYDAVIVKRRTVPTRARMWHDFLNALVWTTFPRAKLALHHRQHVAIERWIPDGATQLPNARTRELDALALVDEGGVLVLSQQPPSDAHRSSPSPKLESLGSFGLGVGTDESNGEMARTSVMLFGHALFEGLVFTQPAMVARAVILDARGHSWKTEAEAVRLADALLAELLCDTSRVVSPDELPRLPLTVIEPRWSHRESQLQS